MENHSNNYRFCIAPMMEYTDRHFRFLMRLFSSNIRLYTEMISVDALIYGDTKSLLNYNLSENPLALQLGGSDPEKLIQCSIIAESFGYNEINLNIGCPSVRVKSGNFGACLMDQPRLVAKCVKKIKSKVKIPVTVKCRIGIDNQDPEIELKKFIKHITEAGVDAIIIHARKAFLSGISPKKNREVPPLIYDLVYEIKELFSSTPIVINGGITSYSDIKGHLNKVDGVMLGRAIIQDPMLLANVDEEIFGVSNHDFDIRVLLEQYLDYAYLQHSSGVSIPNLIRPIINFFYNTPSAKVWRKNLTSVNYKEVNPGYILESYETYAEALQSHIKKTAA
jgi:tRNA-dihydrouridine synthase A